MAYIKITTIDLSHKVRVDNPIILFWAIPCDRLLVFHFSTGTMMKFTIFKRLSVGFLLILLIVMVLGAYASIKLRELNQIIHSISSIDNETVNITDRLRESLFTQRKFERKYVVSKDKDFHRQFLEIEKSIKKDLAQMSLLINSTENKNIIASIKAIYDSYLVKVEEEVGFINAKKKYSPKDYENNKEVFIDQVFKQLEVLKKKAKTAIDNKINISQQIGSQALRVILILSIASIVMAVLISFYNARTIRRPILLLTSETKEIAKGRFEKHLDIPSPPEINELANAFNNMCDRLKELDDMKADFISQVSHEFRTPLAVIREAVSLHIDSLDTASRERRRRLLSIVDEECERLIAAVNKILNLSRMDAGIIDYHMEKYNLSHLIAIGVSKMRPIATRKRISLEVNLANDLLNAAIDTEKIGQVFDNLLENALKFTPETGKVLIGVVRRQAKMGESPDNNTREVIEVSVSDTGPGIPKENIHDIFDKFKKLHEKGTGFGLYIAKKIINAHGGDIWVESNGRTGSTFFFTVPGC